MSKKKYPILDMLKDKETMSAGMFWSEFGIQVVSYFCAVLIVAMILSATLNTSTEKVIQIVEYTALCMVPLFCIPIIRNTKRRLRDAGYTAKAYLWLLLPVIGWLIFVFLLLKKSVPRKPDGTMMI